MPSKEHSGTVSRSIRHGNMMNKRGASAMYQKSCVARKSPRKSKKGAHPGFQIHAKSHMDLDDIVVIKGKAPPKEECACNETRFTLPAVQENGNLFAQDYVRTHTKMAVMVNEMKTNVKAKSFNKDTEHVTEL
mmetsp:Transcript_16398/g.27714  ORF Transcript_16398/g.27714 Transcript_16398/m.27714 type:complete len:133 (-) Transcript_16398:1832-2230(-)|eukprot:CAMPEP_0174997464 /NCGR_PEP_ID=MMETSP0005-20121125/967_1 /TAXON_ID=420556 /ORGANISM="Ochromonas sp., Strain CCMP1393" /LENGTH=132 /DNA_ID=CAMNT_0016251991 /DNA_START=67 /DNA_END=465 /DNA_ORIENTATION=-